MKGTLLAVVLLLAVAGFLVWKFWPKTASNSPALPSKTAPVLNTAVESPRLSAAQPGKAPADTLLPVVTNSANATALSNSRQQVLDELLRFQTTLEQSLSESSDPQERDALENELTQLQLQIQHDVGPAANPPTVTTELGTISLSGGQPVLRTLDSGDTATISASVGDGGLNINVAVHHLETQGSSTFEAALVTAQVGQSVIVKVGGNEIHFLPK